MEEADQTPAPDQLTGDDALRSLWPGIPDEEIARWHAFSKGRRDKVIRRLQALHQWSGAGNGKVDVEKVLRIAGVNLSTLYAIRQRWDAKPSLDSLGVYVRKNVEEADPKPRGDAEVRARLADLLARTPDLAPSKIARQLDADGLPLPKTTLLRLIRAVRNDLPITNPFGRMITFDNAGADLIDIRDRRQRLCAALDEDTGLVLGWAFSAENDVAHGYAAAAGHALRDGDGEDARDEVLGGLRDIDFRGVEIYGHVHSVRFVGPPVGDAAHDVRWRRLLDDEVHDPRFVRSSYDEPLLLRGAVSGSRIVRGLGDRIGPIWIGTGLREPGMGYRTGRRTDYTLATTELHMQIGRALHERNLEILGRMKRRDDEWVDDGELNAIRGLLSVVAGPASI